ncbi:M23 family metallopeptidase [Evansella cellulosilytica]|uniref:Peptidase M23 n=1 Tax=Evansella cellulosilytica (strain ATCC 21833 / DSM 2522 / FERM P-1141 / JCM 9156 / N-4) TaxID=649639 RepID=E6TX82_EVAC2|nr:M23 family metallopeptidase [Evansella cellulosilytica]ADU32277.1 Peptidase M23 [Evansella cellulosilytica DSM 2522]
MSNHEEKQTSAWERTQAKLKRLMKKRWAMPAIYLTLTAVVLTTFIWLAGTEDLANDPSDSEFNINDPEGIEDPFAYDDEEAVPVTGTNEVFQMPVLDENEVSVIGTFYDFDDSVEDQANSLVHYNNYYYMNRGIDLSSEEGESFDVTAAMSGTVIKAEEDALFGQVVHIEHDEDIVTIYQSLDGSLVEAGQTVKQGDVIGRAGRNLYNADAGVHVHFELRKQGIPVNPLDFMEQGLSALPQFNEDDIAEQSGAEELPETDFQAES